MFLSHDQRFRDILLLCLGFFGVFWFYADFQNHWVPSTISIKMDDETAINKVDSTLRSWNYQPISLEKVVSPIQAEIDVDSLQRKFGSSSLIKKILGERRNGSKLPYFKTNVAAFANDGRGLKQLSMDFAEDGSILNFSISAKIINEQTPFNHVLMASSFQQGVEEELSPEVIDSLIGGMVDYQHNHENSQNFRNMRNLLIRIRKGGQGAFHEYLGSRNIWDGVNYYLENSYWNRFEFTQDTLIFDEEDGFKIARAFLTAKEEVMGVVPKLEVEILPAGSLRKIKASYFPPTKIERTSFFNNKIGVFGQVVILCFGVWLLIVFYLRIKARAIDTRPALVVAVLAGFLVPGFIALKMLNEFAISDLRFNGIFANQVFFLGIIGAVSSVGFFLITAVSDSITRQYWPEKLKTWDLVRRGMFNNKPVGWAILRGLSIGGILVGIYITLVEFVPNIFLDSTIQFVSREYLFGSVANQLIHVCLSLLVVVPTFLILANQVYGLWGKKWIIPILTGGASMLLNPITLSVFPSEMSLAVSFVLGFVLGIFYLKFDFVTLALAYFVFLNILSTTTGWAITNSPDANVFYVFLLICVSLAGFGLYFIYKGNEKDEIPDYVPAYIEELAKEQRVQQELDIARIVQQTFLPNVTPEISGFDTAAICDPAMEAGGDYYDIIRIDDSKAGVAIGDVSGKGIQAAFYMTFIKGVIHSLSTILTSPKELLVQANRLFNSNATRGTFISMIYGVLDSQKNTFTYVRAGHNPMLHKKANGEISWLQPKGLALGMTQDENFKKGSDEVTLQLEKGDVLVLYTDGVTEAQNKNGEFYGEKRLYTIVKNEKTQNSSELLNFIVKDVRIFYGEATQYDDMTLVVIKV